MRKILMPLAVLGLGGLGAFLYSDRGRNTVDWVREHFDEHSDALTEWNETAQLELERLKNAVAELSATIAATR